MGEFSSFCFLRLTRIDRQLSTTWRSLEEPGWYLSRTLISSQRSQTIIGNLTDVPLFRQKYSHYLPLYQHLSRSTSRAASFSKDGTRSPRSTSKNPRPTSSASAIAMKEANAKRRSTMNSRDAAYDEEEQLRRAIAASKGEKLESLEGGGTRRTKRGRSDSEE